jgi:tetratricopeptide (TPR) repeat protein
LGNLQLAEEMANEALLLSEQNIPAYRPLSLIVLGLTHLFKEELGELEAIIDELQGVRDMRIASFTAEVNYFISLYLTVINDLDLAAKETTKLAKALTRSNARIFLPKVFCLHGEILHKQGAFDEAATILNRAQSVAESIGAKWSLWQILATQASLYESLGDSAAAGSSLSQAELILESITDRLPTDEMRDTFLDSPFVRLYFRARTDESQEPN